MADITQKVVNEITVKDKTKKAFHDISKNFNDADKKASKLTSSIGSAFSVAGGMILASGISAVGSALRASVADAMAFNEAMAEVSTLVDTSIVDMDKMTKQVRLMGVEFGKSGKEISKGFYQAISSGISDSNIEEFMDTANKLAVGGVASTEQAVDLLTTSLNAYGLGVKEATKVSNMLFETVKQGKTNISQLSASLGKILPMANQAGIGLDQVLGATATLTSQGVNTAESMTLIKGIMSAVIKPSKESAGAIEELGLKMFNIKGLKEGGLIGLLDELREKTGGSITEIAKVIPNLEGMAGASALAGANFDVFAEKLKLIGTDADQTSVAFGKMADSMAFKMKVIDNGIDEAAISFTEGLLNGLTDGLGATKDITDATKQMVKAMANLGEVAGSTLSLLEDVAAFYSGAAGKSSDTIFGEFQMSQYDEVKKSLGDISNLNDEEYAKWKNATNTFFNVDKTQGLAEMMRVADEILLKAKEEKDIEEGIKKEKGVILDYQKQLNAFVENGKKANTEQLKVQKAITAEKEKQRNGMANELNLMSELKREQVFSLAEYVSQASKSELEGLNEYQRDIIKSNKVASSAYTKAASRTGLTEDTSARIKAIEDTARKTAERVGAYLEEAVTKKGVDAVEEASATAEAEDKLAGAA